MSIVVVFILSVIVCALCGYVLGYEAGKKESIELINKALDDVAKAYNKTRNGK
jgi:hypothetical protein